MRIKDSDDYITARAANPRTGIISPSSGTRTPCTPDSPGAALRLRANGATSPTPEPSFRAARCKANEGRKIGNGSKTTVSFHDHWRHFNRSLSNDPPTTERPAVQSDPIRRDSAAALEDDRLVHMPSAREPQPFTYPGYTPEQIEALKHYRQKTRRVSSEGYDRRLLRGSVAPSMELDTAFAADDLYAMCPSILGQPQFRPYRHDLIQATPNPPGVTVRKRKTPSLDTNTTSTEPRRFVDRFEAKAAALFPPFTSPRKTPHNQEEASISREIPRAVREQNACRAMGHVFAKSIGSTPNPTSVANASSVNVDHHHGENSNKRLGSSAPPIRVLASYEAADLSSLPRVKLVRPELAAVPRAKHPVSRDGGRRCYLGCRRESGQGDECAEVRKASTATVISRSVSSSYVAEQELTSEITPGTHSLLSAEAMMDVLRLLLSYAKSLELPKVATVEILSSSDASAAEKIVALKAVLSLAAHTLALCTTLAMLWKLEAAIVHLLEVLLWPLMVPLRILRWMVGLQ